jgi:hypothetical protein
MEPTHAALSSRTAFATSVAINDMTLRLLKARQRQMAGWRQGDSDWMTLSVGSHPRDLTDKQWFLIGPFLLFRRDWLCGSATLRRTDRALSVVTVAQGFLSAVALAKAVSPAVTCAIHSAA